MKVILILLVLISIPIILSFSMSEDKISDIMKDSIWKEKSTGDFVKVTNMTSENVWYVYIDEQGNEKGVPGNVSTLWFLDKFKLKGKWKF